MLHRLCLLWGGQYVHPDMLAPDLSASQLQDWHTYFELEPWGCHAEDWRTAMIVRAAIGVPLARRPIGDYLIQWGGKRPPTAAEYKARAMAAYSQKTKA